MVTRKIAEIETMKILGIEDEYLKLRDSFNNYVIRKEESKATEIIAQYILKNYIIKTTKVDKQNEFWIYKNGVYLPNGKSEIKEISRKILQESYNAYYINIILNKIEADTFIDPEDFFNKEPIDEIAVENGILNIITKELTDFTPTKIFFNKMNVIYNKNKKCPAIEKFLKDILADESDIDVFYELGGFCLYKENIFEKAFIFVGNGRNGKDKSLELIKRLIGVNNCCSIPLHSLKSESFLISEFFGKMVNMSGEIGSDGLKDTTMFKALTGRSLISAKRKFLNSITFQNYSKFIFACNELPIVYDNSRGFWDRWILLKFPYTFVNQEELDANPNNKMLKLKDGEIINKITTEDEMSGLLNMFLTGLDRLFIQKDFSRTKGTDEVKDFWIRNSNSVMAFCLDCIDEDYNNYISKRNFRKEYSLYCKKHKIRGKSDKVIKITLQEMFGCSESKKQDISGQWIMVWEGIKFK